MSNPQFKLALHSILYDNLGVEVLHDQPYILEWLRRNYIPNGGFENWTGGVPDGWTDESSGSGVVSEEKTIVYSGGSALKLYTPGGSGNTAAIKTTDYIPIRRSIRLRFMSKVSQYPQCGFKFEIDFYDADYYPISTANLTVTSTGTDWEEHTQLYEVDGARYAKVKIKLYYFSNAVTVYVDDLSWTGYNPHDLEEYSDFALLDSTDEETFTFSEAAPLIGSHMHGQDDPSFPMRAMSGDMRIEQDRYPLRSFLLRIRLHSIEQLDQLRRFHAKVRRFSFIYVDEYGEEHTVRWPGAFPQPASRGNPDIWELTIPLELWNITEGA